MSGYKIQRLLKLLNESFPEKNGLPIEWLDKNFHPAMGAWRKKVMDVWCWQAFATYKDNGGSAYHAGSYATVTELIKCKKLVMISGEEVCGAEEDKP
ncbi:hypothetical protein GIV19_12010 [Pseudomonas syringae]|uniref:hypothetical protein n=1 Tax=Pseudomonas syringae TaxID=317 RepID=UPI001F338A26|nr:hypothetical protein [Pseudomonas syringae]MCF5708013.1 hypothetical protein [Pseudomonas syringae]